MTQHIGSAFLDFEIHVGFSLKSSEASRLLKATPTPWTFRSVSEVVIGQASHGCLDAHEVPGVLTTLANRRTRTLESAIAEIERLGQLYRLFPDVRLELEQVLLTQPGVGAQSIQPALPYQPDPSQFQHSLLIQNTPPYEAHFIIRCPDGQAISYSTHTLVGMAETAGVPLHQAVRFIENERIILTTFFQDDEEAQEHSHRFAERLRGGLSRLDDNLMLTLVVERIILCAQPF